MLRNKVFFFFRYWHDTCQKVMVFDLKTDLVIHFHIASSVPKEPLCLSVYLKMCE